MIVPESKYPGVWFVRASVVLQFTDLLGKCFMRKCIFHETVIDGVLALIGKH